MRSSRCFIVDECGDLASRNLVIIMMNQIRHKMDLDLSTCSESFGGGIRWLESKVKFDKKILKAESEERAKLRKRFAVSGSSGLTAGELERSVRLNYPDYGIEAAYVMKKLGSKIPEKLVLVARDDIFWESAMEWIDQDPHLFWFVMELGLAADPRFDGSIDALISRQSVEGYIEFKHSRSLRVLVHARPGSKPLSDATKYWLENWRNSDAGGAGIGILALTELDSMKYRDAILEETNWLKSIQNKDGSWGYYGFFDDTSYALWALARVSGIKDSSVQKGLNYLTHKQSKNGSWEDSEYLSSLALLGLLAAGEGPKIPAVIVDSELMKQDQNVKRLKPIFVHTSPIYQGSQHVKEIHDKIREMFDRAKKEIRITSLFIDMIYEDIINIKQERPELTIKIITRPRKEAEGNRERIAKNVPDLLTIATKGNLVESPLIHSRMLIIDDEEVLVSSADLTRDQLFDEFNAGIWTSDKEAVIRASAFFDNVFNLVTPRTEKKKP